MQVTCLEGLLSLLSAQAAPASELKLEAFGSSVGREGESLSLRSRRSALGEEPQDAEKLLNFERSHG